MPDLWDRGGPSLPPPGGPERDGPQQDGPGREPARAPQINWDATGVAVEAAGPIAHGLDGAYGPAWQQDYGTLVGRTLAGAAPDDAFPAAATPAGQPMRDTLVQILSPGQPGADHPDVQAVLRGALADGMTHADRATVNRAAIDAAVERDPEALLGRDPEIPREHLAAWRELAMKRFPQPVLDQMEAMNGPVMDRFQQRLESRQEYVPAPSLWGPLDVREASGGVVNLDYYAVRVRLPEGTDPGVLLNHVRKNLNGFVDTSKSSFAPFFDRASVEGNVERWNGNRPTGSFVTIDIPGNDGSVAVIDAARDHWTFATVQSPDETDGGDGLHPVSGNRQFGYTDNDDGTVTFYTRGVDRITDPGMVGLNAALGGAVFDGGDDLWQSFQNGIATHVRENGGAATVERPVIRRPDWNRVEAVLEGSERVETFMRRQTQR